MPREQQPADVAVPEMGEAAEQMRIRQLGIYIFNPPASCEWNDDS
jgi:hypothetical protein